MATRIFEEVAVSERFDEAKAELAGMVRAQQARASPEIVRLSFIVGGAKLSKEVVLTCEEHALKEEPWPIAWTPRNGGPYPTFHGDLSIRREIDGTAVLVLTGGYTPPLGVFGEIFDYFIGRYVAVATCRHLLSTIAEGLCVGRIAA